MQNPIRLGVSYSIKSTKVGTSDARPRNYRIRLGVSYIITSGERADFPGMEIGVEDWIDVDAPPLPFEAHWLPRRPLAGKSKHGGYYRMSRERALELPYIEANPLVMKSLVVTDHDGGRADEIVSLAGLPVPSYISMNRHTNDGHIVYVLADPVCLTDAARRRPVNTLARIESGLNDVLGGDVAYGGRTTKNPRHAEHLTLFGPEYAVYSLKDLAGPLDRLGALPKWEGTKERRRKLETSATGRNVELFETTRKWSYPRRGDYDKLSPWERAVDDYAWDRNIDLIGPGFAKGPMEAGEVHQIARSIARWTWRRITRTLSEEQARRGRLGGLVMTDAKREANRIRATKIDHAALLEAARGR
jgi:hypothetical protein